MAPVTLAERPRDTTEDLQQKILKLESRLQREKQARLKAEQIAEEGLRNLYERQRQLGLLETIATAANQSTSVEETMRYALQAICEHTGWILGNVFIPARQEAGCLESAQIWHTSEPDHLRPFIDLTLRSRFRAGEGLPGRVMASGKPAWIRDVTCEPNFPRAEAARQCGCRAAFAFPVLAANDVLAVLEFFHHDVAEPDEPFLGVVTHVGAQLSRLVERRRAEEKLMHDATHDPLTGLPNRLLFSDRLERALATHKRRPDIGFGVIFIDLDRFKLVNDSLGHAAGDVLLHEIAQRFNNVLMSFGDLHERGSATLARLGGDEFTVLLEDVNRGASVLEVAEALQNSLRAPMQIEGQDLYPAASLGVASSQAGYASAADIMRDADLAMYRAKAEGRSRIEVFNQSLHVEAMRRLGLESDLRGALKRREFVLHYQPIVALQSADVTGFEALLRWSRPNGEIVAPADFIPIAEETGLITFIGEWVLATALRTLADWQRKYPREKALTMSVNVSPRQFHQSDFVERVMLAVNTANVPPSSVRLEITESVTIVDADRAVAILERLRAFGVRVSIDDFGTGYSSLRYLHELPFDTVKIDKSFVAALPNRAEGKQIINTILDLARNLNLDVVAEGTESEVHVDMLRQMGCGFAQGYYFSHAVDATSAEALLSK